MYIRTASALFLLMNTFCVEASVPYTAAGTLGRHLEDIFGATLNNCSIPQLTAIKKGLFRDDEITLSAIPDSLQKNLPLTEIVDWQIENSLARKFSYVYPDESSYSTFLSPSWILTEDTVTGATDSLIPNGTSRIGYNFDCAATVAAAMKANVGLAIPQATLSNALSAKYSGGKNVKLALASGQFTSPITNLLLSTANDSDQLTGLLYLYNWHRSHPAQAKPYKLLQSIEGVALFESLQETESFSGLLDSNLALNFPAFQFNWSSNLAKAFSNGLTLSNFRIATRLNGGGPIVTWVDMASAEEVASRAAKFSATLDPSSDLMPLPGAKSVHRQHLKGIPPQFCRTLDWTIESTSTSGLVLKEAKPNSDTPNICEFTVQYTVPSNKFDAIELDYKFVASNSMYGKSGVQRFVVGAETVDLMINRDPELFSLQTDAKPTLSDDRLNWAVQFLMRDNSAVANLGSANLKNASIVCPGNVKLDLNTSGLDLRMEAKTGAFTLSYLLSPEEKTKLNSAENLRCGALIGIEFKPAKSAGPVLTKQLSTQLYMPRLTAPQQAIANASSGQ